MENAMRTRVHPLNIYIPDVVLSLFESKELELELDVPDVAYIYKEMWLPHHLAYISHIMCYITVYSRIKVMWHKMCANPIRRYEALYNVTWRLLAADGFCAYFAATGVGMFASDTRRGGYLQADTAKE